MPHGARWSLAALSLCLAVGIPAASAQPSRSGGGDTASPWIDPPARKAEAEKPEAAKRAAEPAQAEVPSPSPTLAAVPKDAGSRTGKAKAAEAPPPSTRRPVVHRAPARTAVAARATPVRERIAAAPRRTRAASVPRIRAARPTRLVAVVPAARAPRGEGFFGYRPYGYGPGYPSGYADDRLEHLRAAEAAGYLVVRRRSVEFPDGRSLRTYNLLEDGGYD